jgi:hypothetical protein
MSQIVRKVDSVKINSFEPGHKQVPVDLSASQSEQLKQDLQPLFNALIQNTIFKKKFTNELSPTSSATPINITLSEKTLIVTNKVTHQTSRFSLSQDPKNDSLNTIIARIFKIAKNALPNAEEFPYENPATPLSRKPFASREEPQTPLEKIPEPDLFDVSRLSDPVSLETSKTLEKDPFENLFIPSSSDAPSSPSAPKNTALHSILKLYDAPSSPSAPKNTALHPILKLYDAPLRNTQIAIPQKPLHQNPHPQFHFQKDGVPKSERPYLEDLFYELPKKEERDNPKNPEKHTALSDIDGFAYFEELVRLENQKHVTIQADLTVSS